MKQNKETLKSYFETGDKPTQSEYRELIDSMWHKDERITTVKDGTIQINNVATVRNTKTIGDRDSKVLIAIQLPEEKGVTIEAELEVFSETGYSGMFTPLHVSAKTIFRTRRLFGKGSPEGYVLASEGPVLNIEENYSNYNEKKYGNHLINVNQYQLTEETESKWMGVIELDGSLAMHNINANYVRLKNIAITPQKDETLDIELWKNHDYLKLLDSNLDLAYYGVGQSSSEAIRSINPKELSIEKLNILETIKFPNIVNTTVPSSSSDTGTEGEVRITTDNIYVCVATNSWKKITLETLR